MIDRLEKIFNKSITRFILALLIIISIVPLEEVRRFDLLFFFIFVVELGVRIIIYNRSEDKNRIELLLFFIDTIAILSFLPFPQRLIETRYLRIIRLFRLSLLVRFASSLAKDLWDIVSRKEIRFQLGFLLGSVIILTFLSGIVLHVFETPVDLDNDGVAETSNLKDLLWWSFRQIESQDNITQNLNGPFLYLVFSVFLTLVGVFVMSLIIGIGSSIVEEILIASKEKILLTENHIVVIGKTKNIKYLLLELVRILKKNRKNRAVVLFSEGKETPNFLYENELRKIEYRGGDETDPYSLNLTNLKRAEKIIVTYDDEKRELADGHTISIVMAIRELTKSTPIFVELRNRNNLKALLKAGEKNIIPVPIGKFLGTILCDNIIFPGIDRIFEELLTSKGSELYISHFTEEEKRKLLSFKKEYNFRELLLNGYLNFGVIIIGVIVEVGNEQRIWLNPLSKELDGLLNTFPSSILRSIIGIAPQKSNLDRFKRAISEDRLKPIKEKETKIELNLKLPYSFTSLKEILIIGENEYMPSMIEETSNFISGINFTIIIPGTYRAKKLTFYLEKRLNTELDEESTVENWIKYRLRGRKLSLEIYATDIGVTLNMMRLPIWKEKRFDAFIFLSDTTIKDSDSSTLLWLYHLMESVESGSIKVSKNFHAIVELESAEKGELVEKRFIKEDERVVKAIATNRLRTYLMVQNCFEPKTWDIYSELITSQGEEICQFVIEGLKEDRKISFYELLSSLSKRGIIPIGIERKNSRENINQVILNPAYSTESSKVELKDLKKIYAIADTDKFNL